MFYKMQFILLLLISACIFLDPFISFEIKSIIYSISLTIKSVIIFFIPLIVFGVIFKTVVKIFHNITNGILIILLMMCFSNFISTFISHYVGVWVYHCDLSVSLPQKVRAVEPYWGLEPYWFFNLTKLISEEKAMFLGLSLGTIASIVNSDLANKIAEKVEQIITKILYVFTCLIPLFVVGFVVKLQFDEVIPAIIKDYSVLLFIIAFAQFSYIAFIYFVASQFTISSAVNSIKNMFPAVIVGFSTMSSLVAMPLTIMGTEKNSCRQNIASSVILVTVNIHLIGDCFTIPILAYAVLKNYGMAEPAFLDYLTFSFYFVLAKFSVAAIPAGGIIIMLPIIEDYLGFNAEMMSLITAIYVLFDPVITGANILGNGGFAMLADKVCSWNQRRKTSKSHL